MINDSRTKKLIEVSYMYYIDGLSQNEISKKLSISRSNVSLMLSEAKLKGIVQIRIKNSDLFCFDLERKLEKLFNLKRAIVIPKISDYIKNQDVKVQLADATADYLNQILKDNMTISVSWGEILYQLANRINPVLKKNLLITSLTRGIGNKINNYSSSLVSKILADKFKCDSLGFYAPNFPSQMSIKKSILKDNNIIKTIEKNYNSDIAIIEIKAVHNPHISSIDTFSDEVLQDLINNNAIGEFNSWFFDESGNLINTDIMNRNIAINIEQIKNIPAIIGVCGGLENKKAVQAALKSKFMNILITDEPIAQKIISEYDNSN